jgi:hypothetical protein
MNGGRMEDRMRIGVMVGRTVPADTACIEIAVRYSAEARLQQPIGNRTVVAGGAPSTSG